MNWLFDASQFQTRSHCGPGWTPGLQLVDQAANLVIFLSYMSIPFSLYLVYANKKAKFKLDYAILMFIAFIALCGLTHLNDVLVFRWAGYRYFTLIDVLTAVASAVTALSMPRVVYTVAKLPSWGEVDQLNAKLREELERRKQAERATNELNEKLRERVTKLTAVLKANSVKTLEDLRRTNNWIKQRNVAFQELARIVTDLERSTGEQNVPANGHEIDDTIPDMESI